MNRNGWWRWTASVLLVAACASNQERGAVVRDTLPGGIPVVHNLAPSEWRDSAGIQFTEVVRLPTGDSGDSVLVNPGFSAVMDDAGRAYVVDQDPTRIKVFDSTGAYVRTIGRDGAGPGEYRSPLLAFRAGRLYVHDPQLARLTIFDSAGSLVRSFAGVCCYYGAGTVSVDDSGRIVLRTVDPDRPAHAVTLVRIDSMGSLLDTLWLLQAHDPAVWGVDVPGGHATYAIPGGPTDQFVVLPSGGVLRGWTGSYALAKQRSPTDTAAVFTRAWTGLRIPESERTNRYRRFLELVSRNLPDDVVKRTFHLYDMPTERPPMRSLDVDGAGRIWVRIASSDSTVALYDQFSDSGIWQGTVRAPWPGSAYVTWWGRDQVVVRNSDENGLGHFTIYRMSRVAS